MLHVTFSIHRCVPLAAARVAPLTPAAYLRLRRAAAGVSVSDAARRIAPNNQADAAKLIRQLETDGTAARYVETIRGLRDAYPLDVDVYLQLRDAPADAHPRICDGCGCSHWDPCGLPDDAGSCAWTNETTCTRCSGEAFPITVYQ